MPGIPCGPTWFQSIAVSLFLQDWPDASTRSRPSVATQPRCHALGVGVGVARHAQRHPARHERKRGDSRADPPARHAKSQFHLKTPSLG